MESMAEADELMELLVRRGFLWPAFEIYGGIAGFYDYGPLGAALKRKIIEQWRRIYLLEEGAIEIDSPTITPEEVLRASGHVEHFLDLMIECRKCGGAFKVTDLLAESAGIDAEGKSKEEILRIVRESGLRCPECGGELGEISEFNTMFKTTIGPGGRRVAYLRPETAQGIFINFRRLFRLARGKLPLPVVQIGKGYRNEISPRQGIMRLREFTMAEAEVFFDPADPHHPRFGEVRGERLRLWPAENQIEGKGEIEVTAGEAVEKKIVCNELMAYYLVVTKRFLRRLGIPEHAMRFREQTPAQRAHYSSETWDAEVLTRRFGWVEVAGIAYRTDYDLSRHMKYSGENLTAFIESRNESVVCHVVEPSYGIDRPLYCALEHAYVREGERKYLKLPPELAPVEVSVLPLLKRDGLDEKAKEVWAILRRSGFLADYDESGSIGRRYARADEIGTPYCVTVDHRTLEDETVTIRERDSTEQRRVKISELPEVLRGLLCGLLDFKSVGSEHKPGKNREHEENEDKSGVE